MVEKQQIPNLFQWVMRVSYITPVPQNLNLSSKKQPSQTSIQATALKQESKLHTVKGYFIRQPSARLQQQQLNTQRKLCSVQAGPAAGTQHLLNPAP